MAAALDAETLHSGDRIDCESGAFRVPGKTIRDTHPHEMLTPGDILRVSSNIGAVKIAYALGAGRHHAMLRRPTAIKLLRALTAQNLRAQQRFQSEVKLACQLNHPNTIEIS